MVKTLQNLSSDIFYDNGLIVLSNSEETINLLTRTQRNLRLHKYESNSQKVMSALPGHDISQELKNFYAEHVERLRICWDLQADIFAFKIAKDKSFYS